MSSVAHFTLAQYELMVESGAFDGRHHQRVEFIRGGIREMSPISPRHAWAVDWLNAWSFQHTDRGEVIVRIQSSARIPNLESAPEPDVLWLVNGDYSTRHPEPDDLRLLIEVADSSLANDIGEKAQLYAEAGIADYWVVNLVEDCVEVFRDPQPTGYRSRQTYRGDEKVQPLASPDVSLEPSDLFAAPQKPGEPAR